MVRHVLYQICHSDVVLVIELLCKPNDAFEAKVLGSLDFIEEYEAAISAAVVLASSCQLLRPSTSVMEAQSDRLSCKRVACSVSIHEGSRKLLRDEIPAAARILLITAGVIIECGSYPSLKVFFFGISVTE
jgi:hypothetical protein